MKELSPSFLGMGGLENLYIYILKVIRGIIIGSERILEIGEVGFREGRSMGEECIRDRQRQLQAARLLIRM